MEFFWSDAGDDKFFHILNTDTRELTPVRNPLTLYERIYYDDTQTDYTTKDVSHLDGKFVKVVVTNKTDTFTFDRFLDRIQQRDILDLKIQENFESLLGDNVSDEGLEVEDTQELLRGYVDNIVDTTLDKERLKKELIDLMIESETLELA